MIGLNIISTYTYVLLFRSFLMSVYMFLFYIYARRLKTFRKHIKNSLSFRKISTVLTKKPLKPNYRKKNRKNTTTATKHEQQENTKYKQQHQQQKVNWHIHPSIHLLELLIYQPICFLCVKLLKLCYMFYKLLT